MSDVFDFDEELALWSCNEGDECCTVVRDNRNPPPVRQPDKKFIDLLKTYGGERHVTGVHVRNQTCVDINISYLSRYLACSRFSVVFMLRQCGLERANKIMFIDEREWVTYCFTRGTYEDNIKALSEQIT
jgi:hypothetical protein